MPKTAKKTSKTKWIYGLRTCNADMTSYYGFKWKKRGWVEAPDWDPTPECGGGLHFLPWGGGDGNLLDWSDGAQWLVLRIDASAAVNINGKSKCPRAYVVFAGARHESVAKIINLGADAAKCVGAIVRTSGRVKAEANGHYGKAEANGDSGKASAGDNGLIILSWRARSASRRRVVVGYVGENGIKAKTLYTLDASGAIVEASQ